MLNPTSKMLTLFAATGYNISEISIHLPQNTRLYTSYNEQNHKVTLFLWYLLHDAGG
jgi:hypothetical protein